MFHRSFSKVTETCSFFCLQIAFQVLVKALISLNPGDEMELLKKQFQEFIAGLMSLPINIPGSRLYRSLQASSSDYQFINLRTFCYIALAIITISTLISGKEENGQVSKESYTI